MKHKIILFFVMMFPALINAQWNSISFKAGVYTPYDLKTGSIFGIDYGTVINKNVSLMISGDLYYKDIVNDSYLESSERLGVNIRTGQRLSEWLGWHLPITGKVRYEIPLEGTFLRPYLIAGLGYGITHIAYQSFVGQQGGDPENDSFTYNGFVWQLGGGILYRVAHNTDLLFEIIHNMAEFEDHQDPYHFTALNSSGVIFRVGVNLEFLR